jgi:outer membrane protein OmpA-like peptidoglycan-associated protein
MLLLMGCVKFGPIQSKHDDLIKRFEQANVDDYAQKCAPNDFALAVSQKEFAELEFEQGDLHRSEEHLDISIKSLEKAIEAANACRPKDTDEDGIYDDVDQCISEKETKNDYQDEDGCPEFDADQDKVYDDVDQCIDEPEDRDDWEDEDGCPDPDNDKDGILDVDEPPHCINLPEDFDNYQDSDGCPEEVGDTDSDGFLDSVDQCPNKPENKNNYLDFDGCPDEPPSKVRIVGNQIVIEDKIYFETGKAVILEKSFGIINSVAEVLRAYPKIRLQIAGHTDSVGSDRYNMRLSQNRANSVRTHLVEKEGIDGERLESKGFGETAKRIDPEKTPEDKEMNRRVEFNILEGLE